MNVLALMFGLERMLHVPYSAARGRSSARMLIFNIAERLLISELYIFLMPLTRDFNETPVTIYLPAGRSG